MAGTNEITAAGSSAPPPSFGDAFREWARIGLLSFGGPAAQIALMHRVVVNERKWLSENQFLNALSFCMLLPGPEAMQLATYTGWRLHGVRGGLAAGLLFVLPGAAVVLALALIYSLLGDVPLVMTIFYGVKAAVVVIVIEALLRIARRALRKGEHWLLAGLSFAAIFFLALPFPLIVALAALWGFVRSDGGQPGSDSVSQTAKVSHWSTIRTVAVWLAVWWVPIAVVMVLLGPGDILAELSLFFSKLAVVTFGGAYAVLAYMTDTVVTRHGWLEAGQMLDGLGLAETTPGPLILVTEFVGYMAAFRQGGDWPVTMGILGAVTALWATFIPCFLWIFTGAPYIDWLNTRPRLRAALAAITAAVVGVILNLALWFALHVFFADVSRSNVGPLEFWRPDLATLDWRIVIVALASGVLLLWRHWSIPAVLATSAALALVIRSSGL